jgi:hypothetical protein
MIFERAVCERKRFVLEKNGCCSSPAARHLNGEAPDTLIELENACAAIRKKVSKIVINKKQIGLKEPIVKREKQNMSIDIAVIPFSTVLILSLLLLFH